MNLFDTLVAQALEEQPELAPLRLVVEKELLHHDILRIMHESGLLQHLTFIGGTCLRMCYGSNRLSEDLDFTGGTLFDRTTLIDLGTLITQSLEEKYGLTVTVSAPEKDILNVDTWKIKVITRPEKKHLPAQRISIDICAVPSYEKTMLLLRNPYNIDMATSGLILSGQSREEILTDKLLAFALRPNRIKYRDLWDIMWLHAAGIVPRFELVEPKLTDRHKATVHFQHAFRARLENLKATPLQEFELEIKRFLPAHRLPNGNLNDYWQLLIATLSDLNPAKRQN